MRVQAGAGRARQLRRRFLSACLLSPLATLAASGPPSRDVLQTEAPAQPVATCRGAREVVQCFHVEEVAGGCLTAEGRAKLSRLLASGDVSPGTGTTAVISYMFVGQPDMVDAEHGRVVVEHTTLGMLDLSTGAFDSSVAGLHHRGAVGVVRSGDAWKIATPIACGFVGRTAARGALSALSKATSSSEVRRRALRTLRQLGRAPH